MISPATLEHSAAIAQIWNHYIINTVTTFNAQPKTTGDIDTLITQKAQQNEAFLIAHDEQVFGFATYGSFRNGIGYAKVKEHTIMLSPHQNGRGLGRALMSALETHAKKQDIQSLFAGIARQNHTAVAFHHALGYEHVALLPAVGWKFNQWHDLILMRKRL